MADETKKPDSDKPEATKASAAKPEAPKAAAVQPEATKAEPAKGVTLKPGPNLKCIVPLAGGIFLRPDGPTPVSAEKYEKLTQDVGFKRLLAAGTVVVVK